jgi:phosphoglycerate dehydrogenase-like enzyme
VIHPPVEPARLEQIVIAARPMTVVNAASEPEATRAMVEADAFFGKLTPRLLRAASRLRWVQSPTVSLEHYLFPELIEHPAVLTNMRGLFSDVIADHVLGFVLCFARNFHRYVRSQAARRWKPVGGETERSTFAAGPGVTSAMDRAHLHLADQTLGVVGLGQIGAEVARRGLAFGMRVVAVDPQAATPPPGVATLWRPDRLGDLLAESDFVVVAAPHTPETEKLFRREQFRQMKRTAYLINIGRGIIVDLDDLVAALRAGEVAGAGLDVFETEPLPADHPLWGMEGVIITPHVAGCSPRIAERHLAIVLENARRFARGEPLINVADKRRWY